MKKSRRATGIAESIVVMMVILTWVTGMYKIYSASVRLETGTTNKIQAIQIAREWMEAMTSIRNTNWILFGADYKSCWNTLNYDSGCISNTAPVKIAHEWKYTIYKDTNNRWKLHLPTGISSYEYSDNDYKAGFRIWIDSDGFYTATGTTTNLKPLFTREIEVSYIDTSTPIDGSDSNDEKMLVKSIVQWSDSSSESVRKVELETVLSNWKG
jgi:hypothetical protein